MPSRKKAKGKARKAAKEAKEEESQTVVNMADGQRQVQEGSFEEMMQRLRISAPSPTMCRHGCPSISAGAEKICCGFIDEFMIAGAELSRSGVNVAEAFVTVTDATADEYIDVYASKLDTVISIILRNGAQCILSGDIHIARLYASLACYLEECMAVALNKTKASPNLSKIIESHESDDHTLVSFYKKRIPCACLDEKYKEVKSVKKMGLCYNSNCSHPGRRVERSKMLCCTQCGDANYCSVECQKAHWKNHKQICGNIAEKKAAFDSSQA